MFKFLIFFIGNCVSTVFVAFVDRQQAIMMGVITAAKLDMIAWRGRRHVGTCSFFTHQLLDEPVAFRGDRFPQLCVMVEVIIHDPVDDGLLGPGVDAQGIVAPEDEVGILAFFDAAYPVCYMQRFGRVTILKASSSLRPPYLTLFAASWLSRRACSASSLLIQTLSPSFTMIAAL
jgi:hypothetical protein